ncbi:hypothetical protein GS584_23005 [Rhodococcus hoagii]|nr:hypothetical protein [Prescottella equi]
MREREHFAEVGEAADRGTAALVDGDDAPAAQWSRPHGGRSPRCVSVKQCPGPVADQVVGVGGERTVPA